MEQQEQVVLSADAQERWTEIAPTIENLWGEILKTADKVLHAHMKFGFEQFTHKVSPSIEDILLSLKIIESVLTTLNTAGALESSEERLVMNAKQQIWCVQCVASALKTGDKEDYNSAIQKMEKQARF